MAESYRAEQGTIAPTMFVGMGGIGSRIVDRIAMRAAKLPNWESQLRPLTTFTAFDTNKLDLDQLRFIPLGNRLLIGDFDKGHAVNGYRKSKNKLALQWLDAAYEPREGKKPGAGQIRVESRLGFFYQSPKLRERLKDIVNGTLAAGITWRTTEGKNYNIYLYSSLAGGTGSGSFLAMAYLLRRIVEETNEWQPIIIGNFLLSTLLTDVVGANLHADIHANTYAALKELEFMTKLNYKQERIEGREQQPFVAWNDENAQEIPSVGTAPFFISFLFDRPSNFALNKPEEAIADASYLQTFTPNIANMRGALDNYEKNLTGLTRFPGDLKHVGKGYSKNFGGMGAAAMVLPAADLLEYSALRFSAEAVRSQITFGVPETDSSDERARALAKLAVNYSDPKFLSMGDEGRDRVINECFLTSVREMARQDGNADMKDGYWYQLVESVDEGRITGIDNKGVPERTESMIAQVKRRLEEVRRPLINSVSIKDRAFSFHREGVNQYPELVSRLKEEIRGARAKVEQGLPGLKRGATEGDPIAELKLDPITERYLVLRLLDECETKWIPEAQKQFEQARLKDMSNPAVAERMENELYQTLRQRATRSLLSRLNPFNRDEAFYSARDEAQETYRTVGSAARKLFDADVNLSQFRELVGYLKNRSRQYARLSRFMNRLVMDLELQAEELRRGQTAEPRLALSVEVFEMLDEPRQRIWDQVYDTLYIAEGRYLSTFDRATLAKTISEQLKPRIDETGRVIEKTDDETVEDLRRSLQALGLTRLRGAIFGEGQDWGLDLARGLEMEARLVLAPTKQPGQTVTQAEIGGYIDKKIRALTQISGVLARVRTLEWRAFDDGTKADRLRYMTHGYGVGGRAPKAFLDRVQGMLEQDGRTVNVGLWHDPRILIVYDVELPIPLYYVAPVIGEIEDAYVKKAREKKSYNLHTDMNWEETLPNLNPRTGEMAITWTIQKIAQGLVAGTVERRDDDMYIWYPDHPDGLDKPEELGLALSKALYRLGELRNDPVLASLLERSIQKRLAAFTPAEVRQRRESLKIAIRNAQEAIAIRRSKGEARVSDKLDDPILGVLEEEVDQEYQASAAEVAGSGYHLKI